MTQEHVRRTARRAAVRIAARLCHSGLQAAEITIVDLFSGFKAETSAPFPIGSYVSIDLRGMGLVRSRVVWCGNGLVGCIFNRPVDVRRCLL